MGGAAYPMINLPRFDMDSLCKTYDITDKQAKKMYLREKGELSETYCFLDSAPGETIAERGSMCILDGNKCLVPFQTSQGIVFIDAKYLQPFADIEDDIELYERQTESGATYFAVKLGLIIVGIIMPVDAVNDTFVERLRDLYASCDIALFNKKKAVERANGQPT